MKAHPLRYTNRTCNPSKNTALLSTRRRELDILNEEDDGSAASRRISQRRGVGGSDDSLDGANSRRPTPFGELQRTKRSVVPYSWQVLHVGFRKATEEREILDAAWS